MKFWIGGSGELANVGVIWCKLTINDEDRGVHAFIVKLRD